MSDSVTRELEHRYRETGAVSDGERWVAAVLRESGVPVLPIVSAMIQVTRALDAIVERYTETPTSRPRSVDPLGLKNAIIEGVGRPVTPDDMVSFIRGEGFWRRGSQR